MLPSEGLSTVTILDCSVDSALMFSQGSWDYVRRDLGSVGVPAETLDWLEVGPCAPVIEAFNLRRELINYKKVCLHIAAEARRLEIELHQHAAFHFRWRQDCAFDDMFAQLHVSLETESEARAEVQRAVEAGATDSLEHSKRLYCVAINALMRHRGAIRAIHDARDVLKAICLSPRHPSGGRSRRLRDLPKSQLVHHALVSACAGDPRLGRLAAKRAAEGRRSDSISPADRGQAQPQPEAESEADHRPSRDGLDAVLHAVRAELGWSDAAVQLLEQSLIARGGFKAMAMADELHR